MADNDGMEISPAPEPDDVKEVATSEQTGRDTQVVALSPGLPDFVAMAEAVRPSPSFTGLKEAMDTSSAPPGKCAGETSSLPPKVGCGAQTSKRPRENQPKEGEQQQLQKQLDASFSPATSSSSSPSPSPPSRRHTVSPPHRRIRRASPDYLNSSDGIARDRRRTPSPGKAPSSLADSAAAVRGGGPVEVGAMFEALEKQRVILRYEGEGSVEMEGCSSPSLPDGLSGSSVNDSRSVMADCVADVMMEAGFTKLTPIQRYGFPVIARGHSVVCCAQTGCGKTLAYICPIVSKLVKQGQVCRPYFPGKNGQVTPLALIVCPTRELASQIHEQVLMIARPESGVQVGVFFGGETVNEQIQTIINVHQCDVVTSTPGRVLDLLDACKMSLGFTQMIALDEADIMLSMGFDKQLHDLLTERDLPDRNQRQTLLFSATFPQRIRQLAFEYMPDTFVSIQVTSASVNLGSQAGGRGGKTQNGRFDLFGSSDASCAVAAPGGDFPIKQVVKYVDDQHKASELVRDMTRNPDSRSIVFVSRRESTYAVNRTLTGAGMRSEILHGKMDQADRQDVFSRFRSGSFTVLVATSIAARGLDIPGVTLVVNYDMPTSVEQYTHRIGRTGRIGHEGFAISYMNGRDRALAWPLATLLRATSQEVPNWLSSMGGKHEDPQVPLRLNKLAWSKQLSAETGDHDARTASTWRGAPAAVKSRLASPPATSVTRSDLRYPTQLHGHVRDAGQGAGARREADDDRGRPAVVLASPADARRNGPREETENWWDKRSTSRHSEARKGTLREMEAGVGSVEEGWWSKQSSEYCKTTGGDGRDNRGGGTISAQRITSRESSWRKHGISKYSEDNSRGNRWQDTHGEKEIRGPADFRKCTSPRDERRQSRRGHEPPPWYAKGGATTTAKEYR
eukprot:GHVS01039919.1.p1 GENE.GHVS01039919.1~~GHVS01039919.1.p1  ORF type:complete len:907 (-),score=99.78 GHVS01039919.1:106-2826(-)